MDVTTCWNCSLIVPTIPQHATLWVRLDGPTQFVNSSEAGKKVLRQNKSQSASSKHSLHLWQAELTAAVKSLYQLLSKMKSKSQSPFYLAPNYCHFTTTAISSCFPGGWFSMAGFSHPLGQIVLPLACADAVVDIRAEEHESRVRLFGFGLHVCFGAQKYVRHQSPASVPWRLEDPGRHAPMMNTVASPA
jgi:hypothetical protein